MVVYCGIVKKARKTMCISSKQGFYTFGVNFLSIQLSCQRAACMKTMEKIPKRLFCDPNKKPSRINANDLGLTFFGSLQSK
jgi:hypothetical protein